VDGIVCSMCVVCVDDYFGDDGEVRRCKESPSEISLSNVLSVMVIRWLSGEDVGLNVLFLKDGGWCLNGGRSVKDESICLKFESHNICLSPIWRISIHACQLNFYFILFFIIIS